ncbi:hypothetical protein BX666DRAFT_2028724 [Dichotomocladium elegans]|nr:hypothetical protein BX666DRAFT_2028724 [Dichotomocladium elegans]
MPHFLKILTFPDLPLLVPNTGSIARDMLANERNFLIFFKLSCTLVVLGFTVLLKFRLPDEKDDTGEENRSSLDTSPIGYCFIAIGFTSLIVSIAKYFVTQRLLIRKINFIRTGWWALMVVTSIFCLACAVMILAIIDARLFTQ